MIRYIDVRTNPEYQYDDVLTDINYNFAYLTGLTSGSSSCCVTGFTYDAANRLTISLENGSDYSTVINAFTALTISGALTATSIYSTIYSGETSYIEHLNNIHHLLFNTESVVSSHTFTEGTMYWNTEDKTLDIMTDVSGVEVSVGQNQFVRATNKTGSVLTKGQIVYINGVQDGRPTITLASMDSEEDSANTVGFVAEDINNNRTGYVITFGILRGVDTSAYSAGASIHLYTGGTYSNVYPDAPNHGVRLGYILRSNATDGEILVRIQNGYEFDELHDVLISGTPQGYDIIQWNSNVGAWDNTNSPVFASMSAGTLSANTFYSAGTSLETIISSLAGGSGDVTRVQPGLNITTGGTDNFPVVSLSGDVTVDTISATTMSASTFAGVQIDDYDEHRRLGWSAGAISGFDLINNNDGSVTISSGTSLLRISATSDSELVKVNTSGDTFMLVDNSQNYIYVDYNDGNSILVNSTTTSSFNCQNKCIVYKLARNGNKVYYFYAGESNVDSNRNLRRRFLESENLKHGYGAIIGNPSDRYISLTAGRWFFGLSPLDSSAFDTSSGDAFTYFYDDGVGGFNYLTGQTQINNSQYNNVGTLTAMNNNRYRTDFIYLINGVVDELFVWLGNEQFTNLSNAIEKEASSSLPAEIESIGVIIGRIIVLESSSTLENVSTPFVTQFNSSLVVEHNGLAGLNSGDYIHLTSSEYNNVAFISSANTFSNNQEIQGNLSATTFYGNGDGLTNIPISGVDNLQTELDSFRISVNFESVSEYNYIAPIGFDINNITGTTDFSAVTIYNVTQSTGMTTGDTVVQYDELIISANTIGLVVIEAQEN